MAKKDDDRHRGCAEINCPNSFKHVPLVEKHLTIYGATPDDCMHCEHAAELMFKV